MKKFKYLSSLMEFYWFGGFVSILKDTNKIFSTNGKLMASIALLAILLNSSIYVFNVLSLIPLSKVIMADANLLLVTAPGTPEFANLIINLQKDSSFLIGSEWIWLFVHFVLSVFLAIATILASAITHGGKKIAFRNLLSRAVRSWKRPFVTSLYTSIFGIGYFVLLLAILLPLVLIIQPPAPSSFTAIALAVLASVLYIYIAVFCILALVISVLEEMSGFEAVGKAAQILKGMKIQGLLLYLLPLLVSALVQGINYIPLQKSVATRIIIGLLVIIPNRLAGMYFLMTYTIFYYRCKKSHGEEVEFPGIEDQYAIIPTASVISDNIV